MREVQVKVIPRSSRNRLEPRPDGTFVAWVTAPPVEGEANRAVIRLLAKHFGVPPSHIELTAGVQSRLKRFRLPEEGRRAFRGKGR